MVTALPENAKVANLKLYKTLFEVNIFTSFQDTVQSDSHDYSFLWNKKWVHFVELNLQWEYKTTLTARNFNMTIWACFLQVCCSLGLWIDNCTNQTKPIKPFMYSCIHSAKTSIKRSKSSSLSSHHITSSALLRLWLVGTDIDWEIRDRAKLGKAKVKCFFQWCNLLSLQPTDLLWSIHWTYNQPTEIENTTTNILQSLSTQVLRQLLRGCFLLLGTFL